jgi:hypothetical protein
LADNVLAVLVGMNSAAGQQQTLPGFSYKPRSKSSLWFRPYFAHDFRKL